MHYHFRVHLLFSAKHGQYFNIETSKNISINTNATFWHKVKVYFTCTKPLFGLITGQNMKKVNLFFSEISQQINKISKKYCHNYSNAQCYFTCINNTWYLITVPNMNNINPFFSEI